MMVSAKRFMQTAESRQGLIACLLSFDAKALDDRLKQRLSLTEILGLGLNFSALAIFLYFNHLDPSQFIPLSFTNFLNVTVATRHLLLLGNGIFPTYRLATTFGVRMNQDNRWELLAPLIK